MELIKELPEVFEEFAEQRQKSFLAMKGLKDQGVPVVGAYCTYFPAEIARAMGAVTVGLCSVSDETIPDAEKDLPKNLCPLIKSSYGFAKTDKCPFFYFSDVVVGETTCDGKKKMYEYMSDFKDVFVMELPNYRLPSAKSVVQLIWEKAKGFIQKAFTIIFLASIIIWFLQTFDIRLNVAESADESLLAMIGSLAAPLFKPLGFGDWRISTALITGFTAKESVVSTLTVLLGGDVSQIHTLFTPFTAFVFLVFTLLYTPCVAAVATVKREMGSNKAAFLTVVAQCVIAWVAAFAVHALGFLF